MRDAAGEIIMWIGSSTEIEELRHAKETAPSGASRAKDEFLAALSHELRTPLTPALLTAAALRDETGLPQRSARTDRMIHRNIELEARLIDDLLDLTRISHGKLQLRSASLRRGGAASFRGGDRARRCAGERKWRSSLISTARASRCRATRRGCSSSFGTCSRTRSSSRPRKGGRKSGRAIATDQFALEVQDNGVGIPPDALERIFLSFRTGAPSPDHRFGGLGLGLAISKAIVDLHGGAIVAQSAGQGQGATFCVELPAEKTRAGAATGDPARQPLRGEAARLAPLRLLVVEDHEATLDVFRGYCRAPVIRWRLRPRWRGRWRRPRVESSIYC